MSKDLNKHIQEKFPHLEISVVSLSEVRKTYRLRIDSEYYERHFIKNEQILKSEKTISDFCKNEPILNIKLSKTIKNFHYLEIANVESNGTFNNCQIIENNEIPDRATYILKDKDIVVSTVRPNRNSVGFVLNPQNLVASSGFTVLRIDEKLISPYFLFVFCKTKFFIKKLIRENTATMYPAVSDYDVLNVKIPLLPQSFQLQIEEMVKSAHSNLETSKSKYKDAEDLLLETLGLKDWKPSDKAINIKQLKESFLQTGRLDAEYYQPKYEEIINKIKAKDFARLGELVTIKKSIEPGSEAYRDAGIPFVRVSNLSKAGITQPEIFLDEQEFSKTIKPKKDTVLLSKDGTVGIAYKCEQDLNVITSGAILHLAVQDKNVLPDYLTLALNSEFTRLQAERDAGGSIIQHWKPSEIENVIIPILPKAVQSEIADYVQKSFELKNKAETLLDEAKTKVEAEIEFGTEFTERERERERERVSYQFIIIVLHFGHSTKRSAYSTSSNFHISKNAKNFSANLSAKQAA